MKRTGEDVVLIGVTILCFSLLAGFCFIGGKTVYQRAIDRTVKIETLVAVEQTIVTIDNTGIHEQTITATGTFVGAGAFITPRGHILTCAHLFTTGKVLNVNVMDSKEYEVKADILYVDKARDLALLSTPFSGTPYFSVSKHDKIGDTVIAVGTPLGFPFSVSQGIISAFGREGLVSNATQTDTPINPGNSGGPLVNMKGELVGICSFIVPPVNAPIFTGIGMAVSADSIREFLDLFKGI